MKAACGRQGESFLTVDTDYPLPLFCVPEHQGALLYCSYVENWEVANKLLTGC
jgi:hypothetical protein